MDKVLKKMKIIGLVGCAITLTACAGIAPLPGGINATNTEYYDSVDDLKLKMADLQEGMDKSTVFKTLHREREDLVILSRPEIMMALYGTNNIGNTTINPNDIKTLSGYRLDYKNIQRKHGISSPISMKTHKAGHAYELHLIFKDGALYEKPLLSGGIVDNSNTSTLFDYLNIGTAMRHTGV